MTALTTKTLPDVGAYVPVPTYDRKELTCGIVHFGVGGFHRAHQAPAIDALMRQGKNLDWAICGVGVMPGDARMRDVLKAQDGLYTLVVKHPDGRIEPRVIGSIIDYLHAPDDPETVLARLSDPAIRMVSMTITEGGYNIDPSSGEFLEYTPAVMDDLRPGAVPRTVFGLVVEALRRRRKQGVAPFSVMTCDNMPRNGDVARKAFAEFARMRDPEFAMWIEHEVHFPNSLVDRITPVTTEVDRQRVRSELHIDDEWPVVTEPFLQWVLEDNFHDGVRPAYEHVGVQLVDDVRAHEQMKLRLLNGSHQVMAHLAYLMGYRYVHEAVEDPLIRQLVREYMDREATPTLDPIEGVDLDEYKHTLIGRFSNPEIEDSLAHLARYGSERIPMFLLPVVRDLLDAGEDVRLCATAVAGWARYAEGHDEHGEPIEVVDNAQEDLAIAASAQAEDPLAFVRNSHWFGTLSEQASFTQPYLWALGSLNETGVRGTLRALLQENRDTSDLPGDEHEGTVETEAQHHAGEDREAP